ncbi:hypothetical protein CEXT_342561 [Caerostris extrusa]|uniref:Uncharacterized protein n=1 Tax=Caerostris extrusa TaxID=172846 RepID=A0AAV4TW57_CAEEX|nr:hypothetical protein CEXT_342561 [Caerostris extrusa]
MFSAFYAVLIDLRHSTTRYSDLIDLSPHKTTIGISPTPCCLLCDSKDKMDAQHLYLCPILSNEGVCGRYWQARELMGKC